jgi:hypothetical protein
MTPPLTVGTGVAVGAAPGTELAEPEAAEAEAEAAAAADVDAAPAAGSFGPPGLAATVPHPAARTPATSSGTE